MEERCVYGGGVGGGSAVDLTSKTQTKEQKLKEKEVGRKQKEDEGEEIVRVGELFPPL